MPATTKIGIEEAACDLSKAGTETPPVQENGLFSGEEEKPRTCSSECISSGLEHHLNQVFSELVQCKSLRALKKSPVYKAHRSEIDRVLGAVAVENREPGHEKENGSVKAVAWNIERGTRLVDVVRAFEQHPLLEQSDLLLLTELDYGMARSGNKFIAREIATSLGMNYAFAPCYIALNKGSGIETAAEGENSLSLHGNALLSRYAVKRAHSIPLPNGKDKMRGMEKRLGCQRAVIADVEDHPAGPFRAVALHLDAHSSQSHRRRQMKIVLDHLETLRPGLPVLIGGDWNTTTYNSKRAIYSILGYARRVLMGVRNTIENHYPAPDRWFERKLFCELEMRGYNYRELNEPGACTLHYDVLDSSANLNMAEWVPGWCFFFINWALKQTGGRCSLKLDWFAGKSIEAVLSPPKVARLGKEFGTPSDHDPIVLHFRPASPGLRSH